MWRKNKGTLKTISQLSKYFLKFYVFSYRNTIFKKSYLRQMLVPLCPWKMIPVFVKQVYIGKSSWQDIMRPGPSVSDTNQLNTSCTWPSHLISEFQCSYLQSMLNCAYYLSLPFWFFMHEEIGISVLSTQLVYKILKDWSNMSL